MTGMAVARLGVALLLHVLLAASCCAGRDFIVGGRGGWTTNPAEPFNHWAERNRFQVNDSLVFRYSGNSDSVLVVSQSHYDACNTTDPFRRLDGGNSVFGLANSGPYFFISGNASRCQAGERLIVVVLAVRPGNGKERGSGATPSPPKSSSPSSSPPPVTAPASGASPPLPATAEGNSSCTSPSPALAPPPVTNATVSPPPHSPSSASAVRSGVLACLVIAGAIVLV